MLNEKKMRLTPTKRPEHIVIRKPEWTFSDLKGKKPKSLFGRLMFGSLSLLFPDGERFFIRSVKHFADQISNPQLREDVKAFIGQETQHGKLHEIFNRAILGENLDIDTFLTHYRKYAFDWLEVRAGSILGPKLALSVTAAAEHFTATWAAQSLSDDYLDRSVTNQELRDLMKWHAVEEIEHKHVAFDVLQEIDDSYPLRAAGMVMTGMLLPVAISAAFVSLLAQSKDFNFIEYTRDFFVEAKDGHIMKTFLPSLIKYFKPGFHPSDNDDYELASSIVREIESRMLAA